MIRTSAPLLITALGCGLALAGCHGQAPSEPDAAPVAEPRAPEAVPAAASAEAAAPADPVEPAGVAAGPGDPTTLASSVTAAVPTEEEVAREEVPAEAVVPAEPYRVLILGDSLAATGFGALLEKRLDAHPNVVCYRKGKSASGLARPDFFDWMAEGKRQTDLRKPDLVVVIMGGNDGQDLTRKTKKAGRRVPWKHENWNASYRARMDAFLKQLSADDREVLWLGLPTMGLRSLEKKLHTIRDIQKEAVEALGDKGTYLETAPFVSTEDGAMLTHAEVGKRKRRKKIRAEDRIHFTMPGSEYLAGRVYPEVLDALGLEDAAPAKK